MEELQCGAKDEERAFCIARHCQPLMASRNHGLIGRIDIEYPANTFGSLRFSRQCL